MTVAEIQGIVRDAARASGTVTARGFGTYGGEVPPGVRVVETSGLARVVEYDPADLTVTVESGARVEVLDAALAEHGQWLPADVPWPERTTVGGMIAAGLVGPLRARFGTLRDQLIGLEWVGGEGQVLRSGGRVVKNVAGYDLMKIHVGARGRFGVLTTATFRVRPRPPSEVVARWRLEGETAAERTTSHLAAASPGRATELVRAAAAALDPHGVFGGSAP